MCTWKLRIDRKWRRGCRIGVLRRYSNESYITAKQSALKTDITYRERTACLRRDLNPEHPILAGLVKGDWRTWRQKEEHDERRWRYRQAACTHDLKVYAEIKFALKLQGLHLLCKELPRKILYSPGFLRHFFRTYESISLTSCELSARAGQREA